MLLLRSLSYLLTALTFLPLIKDNYWIFRTLEYPRLQKLVLVSILIACWIAAFFYRSKIDWICCACLTIAFLYLIVKILPYTLVGKKEVPKAAEVSEGHGIKIITANVFQYQSNYFGMLSQIEHYDPDLVMLVETDEKWRTGVSKLEKKYPNKLLVPLDNTYGILFYSRFELSDAHVRYLVKSDIPSIEAKVHLPCGVKVQVYGLHPEPPVPGESLTSTAKDKELMKIAFKARECDIPCIVMGDLNDVAWSYTTSLFTKVGNLFDVRCGRGFYSTFSAKSKLMRFPLDYIFCSSEFGLHEMRRLHSAGSDHFPIYTHLVYDKQFSKRPLKKKKVDKADLIDAKEMRAEPT